MVGVKMGEKDLPQCERSAIAHHLALGALPALEQQRLAFALQGERGDVAFDGRPGGGRAQESDGKHGAEYTDAEGEARR